MLRERRGSWVGLRLSSIVTRPAFERVERLIEAEPLDRSQEVDDITAGSTSKAVVGTGLRVDGERRHLVLVKGAEPGVGVARLPQLYVAPDHLGNRDDLFEVFDPLPELRVERAHLAFSRLGRRLKLDRQGLGHE